MGDGLTAALRRLAATGLGLLQVRLELLGTELEQEKWRVATALLCGALGALCACVALLLACAALVLAAPEPYRLHVLVALAMLVALLAGALILRARRSLESREGGLFALSAAELEQDRRAMTGAAAHASAPPHRGAPAATASNAAGAADAR